MLPSFLMLEINIQSPLQASAPHTVRITHLADVGRLQNCRVRFGYYFIAKDVKQKTPCAIYTIYYKNYLFNFEFTPLMVTTQEQLDSWLELFTLSSHYATCKSI